MDNVFEMEIDKEVFLLNLKNNFGLKLELYRYQWFFVEVNFIFYRVGLYFYVYKIIVGMIFQ